jgi:transcriptional regulator with XRE-family HTH domain
MKHLEELINILKLSQKDFAQKTELNPGQLSRILAGKGSLTYEHLIKIAEIFNVNLNWLVTGKGDIFTKDKSDYMTVNETMAKYGIYETNEKTLLISQIKEKEPLLVLDGVNFVGLQVIYKLILSCEKRIYEEKFKLLEGLYQKQISQNS